MSRAVSGLFPSKYIDLCALRAGMYQFVERPLDLVCLTDKMVFSLVGKWFVVRRVLLVCHILRQSLTDKWSFQSSNNDLQNEAYMYLCQTERDPEHGNIFRSQLLEKIQIACTPEANHRTERVNAPVSRPNNR